jgi:hypothetical protein
MNSLAPARIASAARLESAPLGLVRGDQASDVELIVDHEQVGALAGAQGVGGGGHGLHVADLGAGGHGHLHRGRELPVQFSDD